RRSKSRRGNRACPRSLQKSCGTGGGEAGARAFAPLSYTLQAIQAGLTLTASLQRGEPADVAVVRSVAPLVGSGLGGLGGGAIGVRCQSQAIRLERFSEIGRASCRERV